MPKTLLAVDDSVTMRKALEITFGGEDFRVITAENIQSALGKLGENPQAYVIDTVLGGEDGYALAREVRKRNPAASIVMLASRYSPYDPTRGRDAGSDDWAEKPFDTQQLIDKVRKVMVAREGAGTAAVAAAAGATAAGPPAATGPGATAIPATTPYRAPVATANAAPAPPATAAAQVPPAMAQVPAPRIVNPAPTVGSSAASAARSGTLTFANQGATQAQGPSVPMAVPRPAAPQATAPQATAPGSPQLAASAGTQSPTTRIAAAANGQLASRLGELGLTAEQAEGVLALSHEVIERVVWEVVPQLAETMIREEIARLMRD